MVALAHVRNAQEMAWFSPLVIHSLSPALSVLRFLPVARARTDSVLSPALWGHKKAGFVESKASTSSPISRPSRPLSPALRAPGGRRGGGTSCLSLLPLPPSLLSPSRGGRGGEAGGGNQSSCLSSLDPDRSPPPRLPPPVPISSGPPPPPPHCLLLIWLVVGGWGDGGGAFGCFCPEKTSSPFAAGRGQLLAWSPRPQFRGSGKNFSS